MARRPPNSLMTSLLAIIFTATLMVLFKSALWHSVKAGTTPTTTRTSPSPIDKAKDSTELEVTSSALKETIPMRSDS